YPCASRGNRAHQRARSHCRRSRRRSAYGCRYCPQHGHHGGGLIMAKPGKRAAAIAAKIDRDTFYPIEQALSLIKETATARFDESIDVAVQLGIDPRKSDQVVRGAVVLPAGTGKSVRVAVFTQGDNVEAAREAGADIIGMEDLADSIKAGQMDFDVV